MDKHRYISEGERVLGVLLMLFRVYGPMLKRNCYPSSISSIQFNLLWNLGPNIHPVRSISWMWTLNTMRTAPLQHIFSLNPRHPSVPCDGFLSPGRIKRSIDFNKALCIPRGSSSFDTALQRCFELASFLIRREHSKRKVNHQIRRAFDRFTITSIEPVALPSNRKTYPLILQFHPGLPLNRFWPISYPFCTFLLLWRNAYRTNLWFVFDARLICTMHWLGLASLRRKLVRLIPRAALGNHMYRELLWVTSLS